MRKHLFFQSLFFLLLLAATSMAPAGVPAVKRAEFHNLAGVICIRCVKGVYS